MSESKLGESVPLESIFARAAVVALAPDDVVVLCIDGRLSHEAHARIREHLRAAFGAHRKVLVLDGGADLSIARPLPGRIEAIRGGWRRLLTSLGARLARRSGTRSEPPASRLPSGAGDRP